MKKGDTIICANAEDLINTMTDLASENIESDFDVDKKKNKWNLVITKVGRKKNEKHHTTR